MLALLIVLIGALLTAWLYHHLYHKRRDLPWGPTPLPIVGNILALLRSASSEEVFLRWRKEYGPIYTFWMGNDPIVCVADYAKIIELFQRDADGTFAGRGVDRRIIDYLAGGNYGVLTAEGELWQEQRRFAQHVLRDLGLGKNLMQERILIEVTALMEQFEADIDAGVEEHAPVPKIDIAVGSIINVILFGHRFHGERAAGFDELQEVAARLVAEFSPVKLELLVAKMSLYKSIPLLRPFYDALLKKNDDLYAYFERNIDEHRQELAQQGATDNAAPTDFVDAFLREKQRRDATGNEPHTFSLHQLKIMCFDLWMAGQESTSATLAWAVALLIHHPAEQERMWEELDRVSGSGDRLVTMADRLRLPFTCAVVNEVQRAVNVVTNIIPRRVTKDVVIDGCLVKANTTIIPNISTVLYDEKARHLRRMGNIVAIHPGELQIFPEPLKFIPGRFIDESSGGQLKKCEELIPFSVGKRQCLGEALARMELFLFTANVFHRFKFLPGATPPSLERISGAFAQCAPYQCRVERRY